MSLLVQSLAHIYATAASDVVKAAKFVAHSVLPVLKKAEANEATIEEVTAMINPAAANIERVGFAVLGIVIHSIEDAEAATGAGGLSVQLDAAVIADIKAILPAIKSQVSPAALSSVSPTKS